MSKLNVSSVANLKQPFGFCSAYESLNEPFTNYTLKFKVPPPARSSTPTLPQGCLDYIWYQPSNLSLQAVLAPLSKEQLVECSGALPSPHEPSDHVPLLAHFAFRDVSSSL